MRIRSVIKARGGAVALLAVAAAGSLALGLSSCGAVDGGILIGTTNFTESRVLGTMYQLVLAANGIDAQVKELTTREIVEPALEKNQLQVTPEYLGTFTEYLNVKKNGPNAPALASSDVQRTYAAAQQLAGPQGLTVLTPSKAQDQNAFAITPGYQKQSGLKTLSQLGTYSQTHPVTLGAGPDCPTRPYCEPGLVQTYGIKFAGFLALDSGGPLTIQALLQNKIQVGLVFSSQGSIATYDLTVLDDDKHLQTADNITPVINTSVAGNQALVGALNRLSAVLTTQDLIQLNAAVDIQRQDPKVVAGDYLRSKGLLPPP